MVCMLNKIDERLKELNMCKEVCETDIVINTMQDLRDSLFGDLETVFSIISYLCYRIGEYEELQNEINNLMIIKKELVDCDDCKICNENGGGINGSCCD